MQDGGGRLRRGQGSLEHSACWGEPNFRIFAYPNHFGRFCTRVFGFSRFSPAKSHVQAGKSQTAAETMLAEISTWNAQHRACRHLHKHANCKPRIPYVENTICWRPSPILDTVDWWLDPWAATPTKSLQLLPRHAVQEPVLSARRSAWRAPLQHLSIGWPNAHEWSITPAQLFHETNLTCVTAATRQVQHHYLLAWMTRGHAEMRLVWHGLGDVCRVCWQIRTATASTFKPDSTVLRSTSTKIWLLWVKGTLVSQDSAVIC